MSFVPRVKLRDKKLLTFQHRNSGNFYNRKVTRPIRASAALGDPHRLAFHSSPHMTVWSNDHDITEFITAPLILIGIGMSVIF